MRTESEVELPGGTAIYERYTAFTQELPRICAASRLDAGALTFLDFTFAIPFWLEKNER